MKLVDVEYCDNEVAIFKMSRGVTNALNLQLVNQLAENVKEVKDNPNVLSLVLSSSNRKFFSIGFDIPELFELPLEDFKVFYEAFNRVCMELYALPKPTIAAITGHAIAGGCILTLCCDHRFIADGRKLMGLNEVKLGVPVPYLGDRVLTQLVGTRNAREIMEGGEFFHSQKALQLGLVDQVLPLDQVASRSIEKAKLLSALPQKAFGIVKHNRVEVVKAQVKKHLSQKTQIFIDCWFSDEARERLKEAIKKF